MAIHLNDDAERGRIDDDCYDYMHRHREFFLDLPSRMAPFDRESLFPRMEKFRRKIFDRRAEEFLGNPTHLHGTM